MTQVTVVVVVVLEGGESVLFKNLVTAGPPRALAQWGPLGVCGGAGVIPRASSYWSLTED